MIHEKEMLLLGLTETEQEILYSLLKKVKDSFKSVKCSHKVSIYFWIINS